MYIDCDGKCCGLRGATDVERLYLNVFFQYQNCCYFSQMEHIYDLLKTREAIPLDGFLSAFSFKRDMKIKDLTCAHKGVKYKKTKTQQGFDAYPDVELDEIFDGLVVTSKPCQTKQVKILDVISGVDNHQHQYKEFVFDGMENAPNRIYKTSPVFDSVLKPGRKLNCLFEGNKFKEILPETINKDEIITVAPSKEAKQLIKNLPVAMFRIAYYEYKIRNEVCA